MRAGKTRAVGAHPAKNPWNREGTRPRAKKVGAHINMAGVDLRFLLRFRSLLPRAHFCSKTCGFRQSAGRRPQTTSMADCIVRVRSSKPDSSDQ